MSFIAAEPGLPDDEAPIESGPFWPTISPEDARSAMRIDDTVTALRLRHELVDAIARINSQARAFRLVQTAAGASTLADVEADTVDGESERVALYRRAVYCVAKASLLERYRDFDATGALERKADMLESPIVELRRDAKWALREMLGVSQATVELI